MEPAPPAPPMPEMTAVSSAPPTSGKEPVPPAPPMPEMTAVSSVPEAQPMLPVQPKYAPYASPHAPRQPLSLRDPSVVFRAVIVVLSAISLILLIAGTALDEYIGTSSGATIGCQKIKMRSENQARQARKEITREYAGPIPEMEPFKFQFRTSFEEMNTLSFVIILFTSLLCAIQAAAIVLNVLVLMRGKGGKLVVFFNLALTFLLLAAIVMANINFIETSARAQATSIIDSDEYQTEFLSASVEYGKEQMRRRGGMDGFAGGRTRRGSYPGQDYDMNRHGTIYNAGNHYGGGMDDRRSELKRELTETILAYFNFYLMEWAASYSLLCAAFALAVLNQILLIVIHRLSASGVTTFGPVKDKIVSIARYLTTNHRILTALLSFAMLMMMVMGVAIDVYTEDKFGPPCIHGTKFTDCGSTDTYESYDSSKYALAYALLGLTSIVCALQAILFALCVAQLVMDKALILPLIILSGLSTILLLASVVMACVNFKPFKINSDKPYDFPLYPKITPETRWGISFNCVAASFALGIVNTAFLVISMIMSKRGGSSFTRFTSSSVPGKDGQAGGMGMPATPHMPDVGPSVSVAEQPTQPVSAMPDQPVSAMPEQTTQQNSAN